MLGLSECDETEAGRGVSHEHFEGLQDVNGFGNARGLVLRSLPRESGSRALTCLHSWIRRAGGQSPLYLQKHQPGQSGTDPTGPVVPNKLDDRNSAGADAQAAQ